MGMGKEFGKTPAELLDVSIEDWDINLGVYLYSLGERGRDKFWEHSLNPPAPQR